MEGRSQKLTITYCSYTGWSREVWVKLSGRKCKILKGSSVPHNIKQHIPCFSFHNGSQKQEHF